MGKLVPRPIEWVEAAPISIVARAESTAAPDAVFAVLADHERWPEWFPGVRRVTVLGPAEGVGARRRVAVPGATFDEEFIVWEPGVRWSFTGIAASPRVTRSLVEDCQLAPLPTGGTSIAYAMHLDPPPLLRPLVKLSVRRIERNNNKALANLAARAAARAT
ncbi:MAG: SRPBCC family protein [Microthrixaceae bacterium]